MPEGKRKQRLVEALVLARTVVDWLAKPDTEVPAYIRDAAERFAKADAAAAEADKSERLEARRILAEMKRSDPLVERFLCAFNPSAEGAGNSRKPPADAETSPRVPGR